MFVFTYLPQMAVMAFTSGPLAPVTAALLVLSESSTVFTALITTLLFDEALVDVFDGVLVSKNTTELVSGGREVKPGTDPMAKLGKLIKKPFSKFSPNALIRYFLYLPLNFIPVVGTVIFILLQGRRAGPGLHSRYFQLKGWTDAQKHRHVEERKGAYTRSVSMSTLRAYAYLTQLWGSSCASRIDPRGFDFLCFHQHGRGCALGRRHGTGQRDERGNCSEFEGKGQKGRIDEGRADGAHETFDNPSSGITYVLVQVHTTQGTRHIADMPVCLVEVKKLMLILVAS